MKKKSKLKKPADKRHLETITVKDFIDSYVYRIDLDADYQREKIWTTKEQELLLDSILMEIDIPKIYLVKVEDNEQFDYECIDGKQRMTALLRFFKPDDSESPLTIKINKKDKFTYKELKAEHPTIAKEIESYKLSFTIYEPFDDDPDYVREIFRRLQLGVRLNSGELLKTRTGTIRDFIYKEIGNDGPFLRNTNLSEKRFSRPFTLAQICLNSFSKSNHGEFARARYDDLSDFFEANQDLDKRDKNLLRIKKVLSKMDEAFGDSAIDISSRAVAVSGYLFSEALVEDKKEDQLPSFAEFYIKLLSEIKYNMELLSEYKRPRNTYIMDEFQKYILQASVEGYSINRRHDFLTKAFAYFRSQKSKGKIIDGK
ncbi:MAG: DUF262 domain-containing protein [Bacteroidia bacterium]|nr:DUF262 domain-containing protein [Bacteroidia bacterium]